MQSSRAGSLVVRVRVMGWAMGLTATMLGHGCFIQETNLNYCANINGNTFCDQRYGDQRPFCLYGSEVCLDALPAEQRDDASFDGCVENEPSIECYSPCGGGKPQAELEVCVGAGEETGLGESATTGTESTGGTTSEVSADGTSTGGTSTDGTTSEVSSDGTSTGGTTTDPMSDCGNGVLEDGEECDGKDLGVGTCESEGFGEGDLHCTDACALDTSECTLCGNDVLEAGEQCDGIDLGAQSCMSLGFSGGIVACNPECWGFDVSGCTLCGDGVREGDEECDGDDLQGQTCSSIGRGYSGGELACDTECASLDDVGCYTSVCGNGNREPDEVCDDSFFMNDWTCADLGFVDGQLECVNCMSLDVSGCHNCGNDTVEAGETCDGSALPGGNCTDLGFESGMLGCAEDCLGYVGCTTYGGNCCAAHAGAGCSVPACVAIVCAVLPMCCEAWNDQCVTAASFITECEC